MIKCIFLHFLSEYCSLVLDCRILQFRGGSYLWIHFFFSFKPSSWKLSLNKTKGKQCGWIIYVHISKMSQFHKIPKRNPTKEMKKKKKIIRSWKLKWKIWFSLDLFFLCTNSATLMSVFPTTDSISTTYEFDRREENGHVQNFFYIVGICILRLNWKIQQQNQFILLYFFTFFSFNFNTRLFADVCGVYLCVFVWISIWIRWLQRI